MPYRALRLSSALCLAFVVSACARGTETAAQKTERGAQGSAVPAESAPGAPTTVARVQAKGQLGPGRGTLIIELTPPSGAKLTEGAPLRVSATGQNLSFPTIIDGKLSLAELPLRLPIDVADGALGPAELELTYYYCTHGEDGSCRPERARLTVDLDLSGTSAGGEAYLLHTPAS